MMMAERIVDFSEVWPEHAAIHRRLEDWATWAHGSMRVSTSPTFRLYRSNDRWHGPEARRQVDALDAIKVGKAVGALERENRLALHWCYVTQSPVKIVCELLDIDKTGLMRLIHMGRHKLVIRGV